MKYETIPLFEAVAKMQTSAVMDEAKTYRFLLSRLWDASLPHACFVMLNPSTADAFTDDPTITRCIGFAKSWGYGAIQVVNLFAFRATDPEAMKQATDPVGEDNDKFIKTATRGAGIVIAAWGAHGGYLGRDKQVIPLLPNPHCLGLTKDGHPRHPLYIPGDFKPVPLPSPKEKQ